MSRDVSYEGLEKKYYVKKKRKLKFGAWFCILVLPAIFCFILGTVLIINGYNLNGDTIEYNELGNVNYKVYLKDNDYYNELVLKEGMQYIANLIKTINVDFNYELHSTENINYKYDYDIVGQIVITDGIDDKKVLYEGKEEVLVKNQKLEVKDNNFIINKDIDIDYGKYNDYVNRYKGEYGLNIDGKLLVTLKVKTNGKYLDNEVMNLDNKLTLEIPLSEQTINISMVTDKINNSDIINLVDENKIENNFILIIGIVFEILGLILIVIAIYLYTSLNKKDIYEQEIRKILKNYDRLIVTSKRPNINENNYENKVRVMSIEELIDVYEATKQPIIYYEVIPNEKSYFIIMAGDTLYKLTITKAWLEKQKNTK